MAKKNKKQAVAEVIEPEAITTEQEVQAITESPKQVINVGRRQVAIRLKSGKGNIVVISENDFDKYSAKFEKV